MITLRQERPADVDSARGAARRGLRRHPRPQDLATPARRPPAGRRPEPDRRRRPARGRHRAALERGLRPAATPALLLGPVAVAADCRNRGIGAALGAPRDLRGAPARPRRGHPGRRRALLQPLRLFGRERPARLRCPARSSGIACSRSSSIPARSTAPAALGAAPTGRPIASKRAERRAPPKQQPAEFSWTPRAKPRRHPSVCALRRISPQSWLEDLRNDQLARSRPHHRSHRHDRLRLDRQRHAAADRAPFQLRQVPLRGHRPRGQGPPAARRARHPLHPSGGHQGQLPHLLTPLLTDGGGQGFCVNLSVDTSSLDIMEFCREIGALYIDTVVEPWAGFYFDSKLGPEARSNYALRETVLAARRKKPGRHHGGLLLRRQSRHGVLVRQAGAAQCRRRPRPQVQGAEDARGMGPARQEGRRQGHPYRRARHPARQASRSRWTPSSTPGRSRASSPRACSRPNSAGARMRSGCRRTASSTRPAARRRSI